VETPAADLVQRDFTAPGPNQLWVAYITYIPTWAGLLFLAIVLDAYSRRIVGWAMATHPDRPGARRAQHGPDAAEAPGVIHHSDQGSQYPALAFGRRCAEMGDRPSRSTVGDAYDNAMAESFFATLECELLDRRRFRTQGRGPGRGLPLHRRLVQSPPAALGSRPAIPHHL
jgi:putative transposase